MRYLLLLLCFCSSLHSADLQEDDYYFSTQDVVLVMLAAAAITGTTHLLLKEGPLDERESIAAINVQILLLASFSHLICTLFREKPGAGIARKIFLYVAAYTGGLATLDGWAHKFGLSIPYEAAQMVVIGTALYAINIDFFSGVLRRVGSFSYT